MVIIFIRYYRFGELPHLGKEGEAAMQAVMKMNIEMDEVVPDIDAIAKTIKFEDILSDADGVDSFTAHLIREFSIENIVFWKECQNYRALEPTNTSVLQNKAEKIVEGYILDTSPNQVNLCSGTFKELRKSVTSRDVHISTFDKACDEIVLLMSRDSFARYKKGDLFQKFVSLRAKKLLNNKDPKDKTFNSYTYSSFT